MTDLTIDLTDANPGTQGASAGDKLTWHNGTSSSITLNPPSCVSPSTSDDIAAGGDSRQYTVNNGTNGDYNYSFSTGGPARGVRNGTINVS